jgi:DNA-binding response OmpR family regulator
MASRHPFRPLTVLLVDDDRSVRAIVTRFLAKDGVVVITESEGRKALEIGRRYGQVLDLLITDVYMPGQDGISLALELRAAIPGLRVLFITGSWSSRLEVATQTGMGCLIEPFTERQLINAVRQLVCVERLDGQSASPS